MHNPFSDEKAILLWSIPEFGIAILKYCRQALENSEPMRRIHNSWLRDDIIDAPSLATHIGRLAIGANTASYNDQHSQSVSQKTMHSISWLETRGYLSPAYTSNTWREKWITPAGFEAAEADPNVPVPDVLLMPREKLHPELRDGAWGDFARREYSTAVFKAYLKVEISLRNKSGIKKSGKQLVTAALSVNSGTIRVSKESEQEATMMLFAGAIGLFRNAAGHDIIEYDDPERAARELQLADLLLRMLDELEQPAI